MLFIGRFFLFVNTWTAIFAEWLIRGETTGIDVSHRIFNVDCRVSIIRQFPQRPATCYSLIDVNA